MPRSWLPASAFNFRDVGGLAPGRGGRTRSGMLFRSATPQFMTREDAYRLVGDFGLRLVVDLRFPHEVAAEGSGHLDRPGVRHVNVPVVGAGGASIGNAVLTGAREHLGEHYVGYVEQSAGAFVAVVRALAAPDGPPALVHCAAGKDRTGVAVALVLSALGVPDECVVADYARTHAEMPALLRRLAATPTYGPSLAALDPGDPMSAAHPRTMRVFLDWLARTHGSAARLLIAAGLEPEALDALHQQFVDRAAA